MTREVTHDLKQWATPRQAEIIDAVIHHGSHRRAAAALGCACATVSGAIKAVHKKSAISGYAPEHDMTRPAPAPFVVKGVSTYYDAEGTVRGQWVKTRLDAEQYEGAIREWVEWLCEESRGKAPLVDRPLGTDHKLMCVYPMGDPHFGMYSWADETGDDFDLKIAEDLTCRAIDRLVASAPRASTGMLLNLGDFFHADDHKNQTPGSGHPLDVDTRFGKVMQVGLRALIHCALRLLERHASVIIENLPGNHDPNTSFMLALCMAQYFANEPRVRVVLSPAKFRYHRFGKNLLGLTHGDGTRPANLPLIMAHDRPEDWGQTQFRYWYCGHVHHVDIKESPGVIVEHFRTLAGKDAWHAGKGYRSGRDMKCIVLHEDFGEIERHTCAFAMLEAA